MLVWLQDLVILTTRQPRRERSRSPQRYKRAGLLRTVDARVEDLILRWPGTDLAQLRPGWPARVWISKLGLKRRAEVTAL